MSLELVMSEKTIKNRYSLLSAYLTNNNIGVLPEPEIIFFKHIFEKYYTPDKQYTKFHVSQFSNISIVNDNYKNKCFSVLVDNTWYPTSIKRLSGSNRNDAVNLIRAMRNGIEQQIKTFRINNPLNSNYICPVTKTLLGIDAQVDHQLPFHVLAENWLKDNKNISYDYNLDKFEYILQEPHYTKWFNYHLENAILRWVSKTGNTYAHHLYLPNK